MMEEEENMEGGEREEGGRLGSRGLRDVMGGEMEDEEEEKGSR